MHDVIFLNRGIAEATQNRHRNHRRRNRCRKSEGSFEPRVYIGCGKHERDDDADNQSANSKLGLAVRVPLLTDAHKLVLGFIGLHRNRLLTTISLRDESAE